MIMSVSICYDFITYKTLGWFTLTLITTPTPSLIFTFITFGTNHFYSIEKLYYKFKKKEFPNGLKRCLACRKQGYSMGEIINHVKNPNHNKLIISSYSKYVYKPKRVIDFIEYNKNILAKAETLEEAALGLNNSPDPMVKIMAEKMIYNFLTTKPADVLHEITCIT